MSSENALANRQMSSPPTTPVQIDPGGCRAALPLPPHSGTIMTPVSRMYEIRADCAFRIHLLITCLTLVAAVADLAMVVVLKGRPSVRTPLYGNLERPLPYSSAIPFWAHDGVSQAGRVRYPHQRDCHQNLCSEPNGGIKQLGRKLPMLIISYPLPLGSRLDVGHACK